MAALAIPDVRKRLQYVFMMFAIFVIVSPSQKMSA